MSLSPAAIATLSQLEFFGIKLGLETMQTLLQALGDPQRRFPGVLVAGTNGKGSTSTLLAAIAGHAGLTVGLYTSPHLESPRERVRVDGRALPGPELSELLLEVVAVANRVLGAPPTYFEAFTAAAFCAFARRQVDLAVLEVGMGGRLDATNTADPILSIVTPIGLDHQQYLGNTLTEIAGEKAGVLRRGAPAVAWVPAGEARTALAAAATRLGCDLEFADTTCTVAAIGHPDWTGTELRARTPAGDHLLRSSLLGAHQLGNIALAVRAAERLRQLGWTAIGDGAIARGVAAARWPGRLERVDLRDGRRVLLDGAHNPDGADVLASFLRSAGGPYDLLFGALADKETERMLPQLVRGARRVTLTSPPSPRALAPAELLPWVEGTETIVEASPDRALDLALAALGPGGAPLVVCGSLYLVGALRHALRQRFGVPPAAEDVALW